MFPGTRPTCLLIGKASRLPTSTVTLGADSTLGKALKCSFELVQLETGLAGNFLTRNFSTLGNLAMHSWLKLLWDLINYYKVSIQFPQDISIPLFRERDQVLMEDIIQLLPLIHWTAFYRVCKFHKVYYVSELTLYNGNTLDPALLTTQAHTNFTMRFP